MASIEITVLGSGTSQGIPVIACTCPTCQSNDPRDKRLRCSLLVQSKDHSIVIDAGPDFRAQMLRQKVTRLDALFLTHEHNDHIIGMDDVRPFIFINREPLPVYGLPRVLGDVKKRFAYAFSEMHYPGVPRFELHEISENASIEIGNIRIKAVPLMHGSLDILGYIINDRLAYFTDVNYVNKAITNQIKGIEVLVLDALHHREHHSHFNLDQASSYAREVGAQATYLIHVSHNMGKTAEWEQNLSPNVFPTYDGMKFEFS